MEQLTVGLTAHVDAGKTTLAEALLFHTGEIKKQGRVDHGDTLLDHDAIERSRGITVFAHQASFTYEDIRFTLMDTPGHSDFSAETERVLQILDCAVLVISGTDGVQSHTRTIWRLLEQYHIPTVLFINKMDISERTETSLIQELQMRLSPGCLSVNLSAEAFAEQAALCSESLMNSYLEKGNLSDAVLCRAAANREWFPCVFGSARTLQGIGKLLETLRRYIQRPSRLPILSAHAFKISVDSRGNRLTYLKLWGGTLHVRDEIRYCGKDHQPRTEKITEIRFYSGAKYIAEDSAEAGSVFAVTGLSASYAGLGLGAAEDVQETLMIPVMRYQVRLPEEISVREAMQHFRILEEEDPQLHIAYDEHLHRICVSLMGRVQLEILTSQIQDRFGYTVAFDSGTVAYRETIREKVEGIGHYEPLRHYAEVHLLLTPLPAGSGMQYESHCSEDVLDRSWQHLILTHLQEREHLGILTGSPITDIKITLESGKAHLKHTEGGDFRQATERAVRQGLRSAESILLEPYYEFQISLPADAVGRVMNDLRLRGGTLSPPAIQGETAELTGNAPVAAFGDYAEELLAVTGGEGALSLSFGGYHPCQNAETVRQEIGYDPDSDTENSADSVFCSHGAGFLVPWNEVSQYMHLPSVLSHQEDFPEEIPRSDLQAGSPRSLPASDEELMEIYERTYGKIQRNPQKAMRRNRIAEEEENPSSSGSLPSVQEYLLVDGYNIIFSWESLKALAADNLEAARLRLIDIISDYQGYCGCEAIIVFDAYRVKGQMTHLEQHGKVHVVYTREAETADSYIERVSKILAQENRVRVATSDALEQCIIFGNGALRVSARELEREIQAVKEEYKQYMHSPHPQKAK